MVDNLNASNVYKDRVIAEGGLFVEDGLVIGPGGVGVGDESFSWRGQTRVQVADVAVRALLVNWRAANDPITETNPLLVWRADGSMTGVNELTTNGYDWYAESPMAGDVEMTLAGTAPYGWLLLQGQTINGASVDYPALWAAASPVFRSGGNLILPDMRGRAPIGAGQGAGLTLRNLGNQTGAEAVTLSAGQMPTHKHVGITGYSDINAGITTVDADSNPTTTANLRRGSGGAGGIRNVSESDHRHSFTTDAAGSGQAHPNMQPSLALNFKVKV